MIININGAKNSSLPIISSCLLTKGIFHFSNVPKIKDIYNLCNLLKQFNAIIQWQEKKLIINTNNICLEKKLQYPENFRGSYYLIGRRANMIFKKFDYQISKGCEIGKRPIDYHIDFITKFGYKLLFENNILSVFHTKLVNKQEEIHFEIHKKSVGTTLNSIILSVKSNKIVYLTGYSKEPYIFDTIQFLIQMGANIEITDKTIKIVGKQFLKPCNYSIMYDPIETGTYITLAALLKYYKFPIKLLIGPIEFDSLGKYKFFLEYIGILFNENKEKKKYYNIDIDNKNYKKKGILNVKTGYYPEIYTDLQPMLVLLLSELEILSVLEETVWEDRFKYIAELNKMGHNITVNNNIVIIKKKKEYQKIEKIKCYDLRADAALLIASLCSGSYHEDIIDFKFINRGYFKLNTNILNISNMINKND